MTACGPLCAPIAGGAEPCPFRQVWANVGRLWEALRHKASGPFCTEPRDERKSRINAGVAVGASGRSLRPAVRVVAGVMRCIKSGVKNSRRGSRLRSLSQSPYCLTPEKKAILERRYQEDGSRSMTAFIERAVDFYLDYFSANNAGLFLPTSIKSYLDGRMGQLEERLSSIAFRQAVEQDMVAGILADAYQFSGEDLRRRRAESVQNVRKTNGRISLEQRVRGAWEEDDEWQD